MKTIRLSIVSIVFLTTVLMFQNCDKKNEDSDQDVTINTLASKEWVVSSVDVPSGTATISEDWVDFKMSLTATKITTSGHPTGASAVWPSGTFTLDETGKIVTRHDGVEMRISSISGANVTVGFSVPEGTETGGRSAALGGDYTFNMK